MIEREGDLSMGGFDTETKITIRNPKWDPGEEAEARVIPTAGDKQWVLDQQLLFNQRNKGNRAQRRGGYGGLSEPVSDIDMKSQLGAVHRLWVQRMLLSWTIMKKGQIIPLPPLANEKERSRVLAALSDSYVEYIYAAILKEQPKEDEADEDEEEEEEDEGTPFIDDASHSIAIDINTSEGDWSDLLPLNEGSRNYLTKS
jgi:hypothetical protein